MKPRWFRLADLPFDQMWPDHRDWYPFVWEGEFFTVDYVYKDIDNITSKKVVIGTKEEVSLRFEFFVHYFCINAINGVVFQAIEPGHLLQEAVDPDLSAGQDRGRDVLPVLQGAAGNEETRHGRGEMERIRREGM